MTKPVDLIHSAARAATHPKFQEHVLVVRYPLQHLLDAVTKRGEWHYIDVPVSALVGVQNPQRGAPTEPFTWRQAALCLHCEGWGQAALDYLDGPLHCDPMPEAPGAKRALKLTCYARAVVCTNGTHGLAAALVRRLRPGADGLLHLAATAVRPEVDNRVQRIVKLACQGDLEFAHVHAPAHVDQLAHLTGVECDLAVRVRAVHRDALLAFPTGGGPVVEVRPRSWLQRQMASEAANEVRDTAWFDWQPIPGELITAWRGRAWLDQNIARGECVGEREPMGPLMA